MPSSHDICSRNADRVTGTRFLPAWSLKSALLTAPILLGLTVGGFAQTQQLRGLSGDPRANLPSARNMLQRQQDKQIDTFSTRQSIEQSERRQNVDRMNENTRGCAFSNGADCLPPPAK